MSDLTKLTAHELLDLCRMRVLSGTWDEIRRRLERLDSALNEAKRLKEANVALMRAADAHEVERDHLKERLEKCGAALEEAQQAFSEIYHAYTNPSWFTKGEHAARNHIFNWIDRGSKTARAAVEEK